MSCICVSRSFRAISVEAGVDAAVSDEISSAIEINQSLGMNGGGSNSLSMRSMRSSSVQRPSTVQRPRSRMPSNGQPHVILSYGHTKENTSRKLSESYFYDNLDLGHSMRSVDSISHSHTRRMSHY